MTFHSLPFACLKDKSLIQWCWYFTFYFGLDLKAKEDGAPVKIKLIVQSLLLFSLCTSCLWYRYFSSSPSIVITNKYFVSALKTLMVLETHRSNRSSLMFIEWCGPSRCLLALWGTSQKVRLVIVCRIVFDIAHELLSTPVKQVAYILILFTSHLLVFRPSPNIAASADNISHHTCQAHGVASSFKPIPLPSPLSTKPVPFSTIHNVDQPLFVPPAMPWHCLYPMPCHFPDCECGQYAVVWHFS